MSVIQLKLIGVTCGGCTNKINKALIANPAVEEVEINLEDRIAFVESSLSSQEVISIIKEAGYDALEV
ncbi:MAG: heavy-metal-associated domain-containing protein [Psittacicella sp.]